MQPRLFIEVLPRKPQVELNIDAILIRVLVHSRQAKGPIAGLPDHLTCFVGEGLGGAQMVVVNIVQLTIGRRAVIHHRDGLAIGVDIGLFRLPAAVKLRQQLALWSVIVDSLVVVGADFDDALTAGIVAVVGGCALVGDAEQTVVGAVGERHIAKVGGIAIGIQGHGLAFDTAQTIALGLVAIGDRRQVLHEPGAVAVAVVLVTGGASGITGADKF